VSAKLVGWGSSAEHVSSNGELAETAIRSVLGGGSSRSTRDDESWSMLGRRGPTRGLGQRQDSS
jgi:hypothetical protein